MNRVHGQSGPRVAGSAEAARSQGLAGMSVRLYNMRDIVMADTVTAHIVMAFMDMYSHGLCSYAWSM